MRERIEELEELEESINELEHELFISLPFKRSQAHVRGECDKWIDEREKEIDALILHKSNCIRGYENLLK